MRKPFFLETISSEPFRNCKILSLLQFHDIEHVYTRKVSENDDISYLFKIYLEFSFLAVYAKMNFCTSVPFSNNSKSFISNIFAHFPLVNKVLYQMTHSDKCLQWKSKWL